MKLLIYVLFQVLLTTTISVSGLNILGIFPHEGKSHFIVFNTYLQELVKQGHNVTVISHFPKKSPIKNYHDIDLAGQVWEDNSLKIEKSYLTVLATGYYLAKFGIESCERLLANQNVRNLIDKRQQFDLVVMEQFNSDCGLGLAYKLKAPVVGITSGVLMPFHYDRFGIPYNPSYVPFHFLDGGTKPSLIEKTAIVFFDAFFKAVYHFGVQRVNQNTLAKYYADIPPLEDLAREIKLVLVYQNFVLTGSRLLPANVIEVGGFHVTKAKPLTGELKKFVEGADHGVVYISFGSVIKASTMDKDKVDAILAAVDALPQRFIWKWEDDTLKGTRKNLYIDKWLPQVDIFGHPKTLAFLSHAGMGGTTEAIHYGIPMIASPIFGDQPSNAEAVEESGLGVILHLADITNTTLITTLKKVLDPDFREKAKQVSKAWHDRPLSPLDTAVFWTEFAARNSNLTLRTAAADVRFYQYLNLDVVAVFLLLFIVVFYLLKFFFSLCCRKKDVKKEKQVKTKKNKRE